MSKTINTNEIIGNLFLYAYQCKSQKCRYQTAWCIFEKIKVAETLGHLHNEKCGNGMLLIMTPKKEGNPN